MKIIIESDCHGILNDLSKYSECDIYINLGDLMPNFSSHWRNDKYLQLNWVQSKYLPWISNIPARYKIQLGGNHDGASELSEFRDLLVKQNIITLNHELIEIEGIKIFGSPYTYCPPNCGPERWCWGASEENLEELYKLIPDKIDILATHGPSYGILDCGGYDKVINIGSKSLRKRINEISFKYHIFGHEHWCAGCTVNLPTKTIINCAQRIMKIEI